MTRFRILTNSGGLLVVAAVAVLEMLSSRPGAQTLTGPEGGPWGITGSNPLAMPAPGDHGLRVLSPLVLELTLITTKAPDAKVEQWGFVDENGALHAPDAQAFAVTVDGAPRKVKTVGFKRRVLYAPLKPRDLRIGNYLYLELTEAVPDGAEVDVKTADSALWKPETSFAAIANRLRWSPAIHVNQVGY